MPNKGDIAPGNRRIDVIYLYVTGIFTVLMTLIPFFRGVPQIPYMIPIWIALYAVYRFKLIPERFKFLAAGSFLAACYLVLGYIASSHSGDYHGVDVLQLELKIFGVLPSRWLQNQLITDCRSNWFDYPLAVCHSIFFAFPFVTPWLILRKNGILAMKKAVLAFALITTAGYATYILWPLTPPWLLAVDGVIEPLNRCVFCALQKVVPSFLVSGASNTPRAAMPSLHAGVTLLMAMLLNRELGFKRAVWSWIMLALICFEIIYGAEHFIIDIVAGFIFAIVAFYITYAIRFESG